jgi:DHA3 family tetracycline resistance protein-like MFS transporter
MTLIRSLAYRPFALLWSGQTISRLGDNLYRVALFWWAAQQTESALATSIILFCTIAPMLLFVLIGGVTVDRFPRIPIMLASDVIRGCIVIVIAVLAQYQALEIWHIYIASILFGTVDAFFQPAFTAVLPEITPAEILPSANSLTTISQQAAAVIGALLGATLVALVGTAFAFTLNGLSFFVSALCLLPLLRLSTAPTTDQPATNILHDVRQGLSAVMSAPWLWITISIIALGNITSSAPFTVALPFLVKETLGAEINTFGLAQAMLSLGVVLGAVWLGRLRVIRRRGLMAYGAWLVSGLLTLAIGLPIGTLGIALASLLVGATTAAFSLIWINTLQQLVPREMLGRVSSIDYLGSFILLPLGYSVVGWATDQLGAATVFVIGGALTMALAVLGLLHPAIRRLD